MRIVIILILTSVVAADNDAEKSWKDFKQQFNKNYDPWEAIVAKYNFMQQYRARNVHNNRYAAGMYNYTVDINQFSDSDLDEELNSICRTFYTPETTRGLPLIDLESLLSGPLAIDFTSLLQPVINQGQCGSCWAYSAIAQYEAFYRRTSLFYNYRFSPQYLIDCSRVPPNSGCYGGWPRVAMGSGCCQSQLPFKLKFPLQISF